MAPKKVPVTITYTKAGLQPPLFVAGSFSVPPWEPQEMDHVTAHDGENTFKKEIYLDEGSKIQYKFRVGLGDWWVLNEDAPTGMMHPVPTPLKCSVAPSLTRNSDGRPRQPQ